MISLTKINKRHGNQVLFVDANFQLDPGEKVGLVGPNGSGKSTLFRLITGEEKPDEGDVSLPKRITIGHFQQDMGELKGGSVLDVVIAGSGKLGELHHELERLNHDMADPDKADRIDKILERFGEVQEQYQALGGYELEAKAKEILSGLGFADEMVEGDVAALSGGWKMRVGMARVLLGSFDVLLMDEPTNHLDIESILWLEQYLQGTRSAVLMTCHDRDFMNRVVKRIIDIDDGELISYTGDYDFLEQQQRDRAKRQGAAFERQQAMLAKMQRFIDRFGTHVAKAAQAQSRQKKMDKIERVEPPRKRIVVPFAFVKPPRVGEDVAILKNIDKGYGKRVVYQGFDFEVRRGERWCVMGQNGAGKSTLLKMLSGSTAADSGTVKIGPSVKMGYFAQQSLDVLDPDCTVLEQLDRKFPLVGENQKRNLLGAFQFSEDEQDKRIEILSGGEKSRLVLAQMLFDPPNFLVLDEPTNHLDLVTKEMLVKTLLEFEGTMIFVSHDRTFLRGLANKVLDVSACPKGGRPLIYPGSYIEWVEKTGTEAPGVHS
ncbi:ATP-binding protein [Planctomycetota bacterium]|jgi:ATPase subunit of ABC transporter with duplicated ATPase domains|nr:ABC-F family ATP-binding cassette domain-containing protein [Planctomycetota bacterium]MSR39133.1 ABC-F family ATP-binding cassette domain-containing protein [Planctomycetota bacterium]GDY02863.1 ATP-binding protein [Planctomycetota bacterium]